MLLCSLMPRVSPHAFVFDLKQPLFPWAALNLAHCANYRWKEAHAHYHQFHLVLKLIWASPNCAPFSMKDGASAKLAVQGSSPTVQCSSSSLLASRMSVFITSHDLELILLLPCCFPFVFVQYPFRSVSILYLSIYKS